MQDNIVCGIYKITSPSKKIYIGQSINIYRRWDRYYKNAHCKKQTLLYRSFKKYGAIKHKLEVLHICSKEELDHLEAYYIELYQSFNEEYGLNLTSGGKKYKIADSTKAKLKLIKRPPCSDEWRKLISRLNRERVRRPEEKVNISLSKMGEKNPNYGKPKSEEWKARVRAKLIGRKRTEEEKQNIKNALSKIVLTAWNKGKTGVISDEARRKMSESRKGKKNPMSEATKIKIGLANKNNYLNKLKLQQ